MNQGLVVANNKKDNLKIMNGSKADYKVLSHDMQKKFNEN